MYFSTNLILNDEIEKKKTIKRPKKKKSISYRWLNLLNLWIKSVRQVHQTCELGYELYRDYYLFFFFKTIFLFNYMITKIDDYEIKHQLNTEICF